MNYYCSQLNLVLTSFGKSLTQVKIFAYIDVLNGMQCQFKEIQKVLKRLDCRSLPRSLQRESLEVLSLSSSMSSSSTPSSRCPPFIAIVNNSSIYIISKKRWYWLAFLEFWIVFFLGNTCSKYLSDPSAALPEELVSPTNETWGASQGFHPFLFLGFSLLLRHFMSSFLSLLALQGQIQEVLTHRKGSQTRAL